MSQKTLKELLKPPFYHRGIGHILDGNTWLMDVPGYVSSDEDKNDSHLANVRGWGFFQYFKNGEQLQDEFVQFVTDALNEKWVRDFGEQLVWDIDDEYDYRGIRCPKCGKEYGCFVDEIEDDWKYCPNCGQRLYPPETEV